jgi:hypothetical protein
MRSQVLTAVCFLQYSWLKYQIILEVVMDVSDNILPASCNENGGNNFFRSFSRNWASTCTYIRRRQPQHHNIKMIFTYVSMDGIRMYILFTLQLYSLCT